MLLIDWSIFPRGTANQKHYSDLGSDASSVWNFCARSSDVIWRENQRRRCQMLAVFSGQLKTTLGSIKCHDRDDNKNVKKEIGWIGKTTTRHVQHAFLYISLPSLHDYDGKMPNFTIYGGRKQATAKFSFSFYTWIWFLVIRLKKSSLAFDVVNELE